MARRKRREEAGADAAHGGVRLAGHPRARRDITRAKAWAGLVAFAIVLLVSLQSGAPRIDAVLRATCGGVAAYLAGWALAVAVWRHVAVAQVEQLRRRLLAEQAERAAEDEVRAAAEAEAERINARAA
jgi:protein-S-isoprenylcysteine O-methyltransferase Ste14